MSFGQLQMPGLSDMAKGNAEPAEFGPGQEVLYLGRVSGGPRYGARGIVRELRGRKAVVEIRGRRRANVWHIPCYFLTMPGRAA